MINFFAEKLAIRSLKKFLFENGSKKLGIKKQKKVSKIFISMAQKIESTENFEAR